MTNKTEDRFYFGKPGQPERFGGFSGLGDWKIDFRNVMKERVDQLKQLAKTLKASVKLDRISPNGYYSGSVSRRYGAMEPPDLSAPGKVKALIQSLGGYIGAAFSRPGQPERFSSIMDEISSAEDAVYDGRDVAGVKIQELLAKMRRGLITGEEKKRLLEVVQEAKAYGMFSRPGEPERFGLEDACWEGYEPVGTKQKDGRTVPNCVPKDKNEQPETFEERKRVSLKPYGRTWDIRGHRFTSTERLEFSDGEIEYRGFVPNPKNPPTVVPATLTVTKNGSKRLSISSFDLKGTLSPTVIDFSRPGSPDKFDASSLDRGNFAEASKSPILGKLLAAKVMPDGGWRAVQVGSDTLVISFEDADLARDFGRRASTKGYSATSPVATTGRYWNVEVKNG